MNLSKILILNACVLSLTSIGTSQLSRLPSLFQTVSRGTTKTLSFGNSWLGADLSASSGMSTTTSSALAYESNRSYSTLRGVAKVLQGSAEIGYLGATGTNTISGTAQTRSTNTEVRILGARWVYTGTSYLQTGYNLQLFANDRSIGVDVGPLGVSLSGNAGVSVRASGGFVMRTADPTVRMAVSAFTSAFARASARISIWLAGVEVSFAGTLGTQDLLVSCGASKSSGFFGTAHYSLTVISLKIVLHAWLGWADYYNDLINFSVGASTDDLLKLI
ncbi:MAG: hypothetical protein H6837_11730 [Planctomycetes bacterium]|nr:hypothetical protein [Planctomycetota bacterium]MCB9870519.1 hypothetical protein [Planctomycetota bacterium]